jgi:hypothetical protein
LSMLSGDLAATSRIGVAWKLMPRQTGRAWAAACPCINTIAKPTRQNATG